MGKQWKQCQTLFWGAPKSLQMVIAAMKLKDAYSLEGVDCWNFLVDNHVISANRESFISLFLFSVTFISFLTLVQ